MENNIEKTVNINKDLAEQAKQLGIELQKLQRLNNNIAIEGKKLENENQSLINQNLQLSQKTKRLAENVEMLTFKVSDLLTDVQNHITGGNSIPMISVEVKFYPLDHYARWNGEQIKSWIDKWIIQFKIRNSGNYPLYNIRCIKSVIGNGFAYNTELDPISILSANEEKLLFPTIVVNDVDNDSINTASFTLEVMWNQYSYQYTTAIHREQHYDSISQNYTWKFFQGYEKFTFDNQEFNNSSAFKQAIIKKIAQ